MGSAMVGFLVVFGVLHLLLIAVPIASTLKASISATSKLVWCLFLLLLPGVGVLIFHFKFRSSLFQGKPYESSAAEERAKAGTLAPHDND